MRKTFNVMMALLVVVLMMASCSKGESEATKFIPEDATVVVRLDVKQLVAKSGLSEDSKLLKKLKNSMKESDMSAELRDKLADLILNPNNSGINFDDPVFLFVGNPDKEEFGLVGSMSSSSKLIDLINQICEETDEDKEVEEEDGINVFGDALYFTDDWFYIGEKRRDIIDDLKDMAAGKGESLAGSEPMKKLCEQKGVMSMLVCGKGLAKINEREMREALRMMPEGLDIEDMAMVSDLQINNGEAVLTGEGIFMSDEWKDYFKKGLDAYKDIDESLTKYISDEGLAMFVNIDVDYAWEYMEKFLRQNGLGGEEMAIVNKVVESLTGSAALGISKVTSDGPEVSAYIGTEDDEIVGLMRDVFDDGIEERGQGYRAIADYSYDWDNYDPETGDWPKVPKAYVEFGEKNDVTYICYGKDPQALSTPSHAFSSSDIKGKGFYARFNFSFLKKMNEDMVGGQAAMIMKEVAKVLNFTEMYAEKDGRFVWRLVTNDEDTTPLEQALEYLSLLL